MEYLISIFNLFILYVPVYDVALGSYYIYVLVVLFINFLLWFIILFFVRWIYILIKGVLSWMD